MTVAADLATTAAETTLVLLAGNLVFSVRKILVWTTVEISMALMSEVLVVERATANEILETSLEKVSVAASTHA